MKAVVESDFTPKWWEFGCFLGVSLNPKRSLFLIVSFGPFYLSIELAWWEGKTGRRPA